MRSKNNLAMFTGFPYWRVPVLMWLVPFGSLFYQIFAPDNMTSNTSLILLFVVSYSMGIIFWWVSDRVFLSKTNRIRLAKHSLLTNATVLRLLAPVLVFVISLVIDVAFS